MKLIVVGGSLATGKSTVSARLSDATGIVRISLDEIKEALFDAGGYRDRQWSKDMGRGAFPAFTHIVDMHLSRGESVIADATFLWLSDADWLHEFAERHGADLYQIWLTADPRVARERFVARSPSRHPGHNDALDDVLAEFDERFFHKTFLPLPLKARTVIVDTTDIATVDHDAIRKFIE